MTSSIQLEDLEKIEILLQSMYNLSQSEDWNESRAQSLILYGGGLYEEIFLKNT